MGLESVGVPYPPHRGLTELGGRRHQTLAPVRGVGRPLVLHHGDNLSAIARRDLRFTPRAWRIPLNAREPVCDETLVPAIQRRRDFIVRRARSRHQEHFRALRQTHGSDSTFSPGLKLSKLFVGEHNFRCGSHNRDLFMPLIDRSHISSITSGALHWQADLLYSL